MRAHSRSCGESVEDEKMRRNTLLSWGASGTCACSRRANMHLFSVELMVMMMMMVMMETRRAVVNALACGLGRDSN